MMNEIFDLISKSNSILLLSHENPDGDAIGSVMAFYYMLSDMKKNVIAVFPKVPDDMLFLDSTNKIASSSEDTFDLGIIFDCSNEARVGQTNNELSRCKVKIVIDHHKFNTKYGDVNYIDENVSSCCQIIYSMFDEWNIKINNQIGEALCTGVITDTNGLSNSNVDKNTFLLMAKFLELGIDVHRIYYLTLLQKTLPQHKLMKLAYDNLEFYDDGKIAFVYISKEDMASVQAKFGDHEGIVDIGRNIHGVEVSVFMYERDDSYYVSLRSNGLVKVNTIACKFGGGGHDLAAGIKFDGDFKETKKMLIDEIIKELS